MHEEPVDIEYELRAITGASVWIVQPSRYLRLPRSEAPRPPIDDLDGATTDALWHEHRGVWQQRDWDGHRLRIVPIGRPADAYGIITGTIEHIVGR